MTMRCTESFSTFNAQGHPRVIAAGDVVDDKDPAAKAWPDRFEPVEAHIARQAANRPVETATSAPGERRQRSAPRRRTTKKAAAKKAPAKTTKKAPAKKA